jgi:adenylate cyclase
MSETRITRRLAAILAADVVGYSRLMGSDEAGTLAALKRHRQALFDPAISANGGRVVKLIGDGTLAEFGSVVDAVKCALAIQMAVLSDGGVPKITLRIGINLGDVIIEGDDIYGDGVNVAARLEPLAEPGGVCISSIVNESVGPRVDARFEDGGEVQVKNIDRPIRVWKWHPRLQAAASPAPAATATAEQPRKNGPSIAVLPFNNMSGDAEQEYFSDGISEDIITDLSKVGGLTVIARNSSFAYKGKSPDIRQVGRDLGVSAVLEGSIRRAGNRIRVNAQLIDAQTGAHIWAERYDRDLTDIFEVQDEVTRTIVAALKVKLTPAEEERIAETPTNSIAAHDCYLRARQLVLSPALTREMCERGISLLREAVTLDPNYSDAHAGWASALLFVYGNGWSDDPPAVLNEAAKLAEKGLALDANNPFACFAAAGVAGYRGDREAAQAAIDRALTLNPNAPMALNLRGTTALYLGRPDDAVPDIEHAIRLDPAFSQQYLHFLGMAHLVAGRFETAVAHFRERIALAPRTDFSRAFLASALGHLGRPEEARQVWRELMEINPAYSFDVHMKRMPYQTASVIERFRDGLTKAGLPD